jgi:hypothetical protein
VSECQARLCSVEPSREKSKIRRGTEELSEELVELEVFEELLEERFDLDLFAMSTFSDQGSR